MESSNRRSILKATATVGIIGGLAGCAEDEEDEPPADEEPAEEETEGQAPETDEELAGVRAAHLSPDAPDVDIYVDDDPVLEDVAFRDVSEYLDLEAGEYELRITEAGEEQAVFEEILEIEAEEYTLAALGELADENQPFAVEAFEDDLSDPGEEARVRVLHGAPDAPAVDIVDDESGDAIFEDLAFGEAETGTVPAGDYTLAVQPADDEEPEPVETFDLTVEEGVVYTAFAVGYLEPENAPADEPFDLEVVEDAAVEADGDHEDADDIDDADDEDDTANGDEDDGNDEDDEYGEDDTDDEDDDYGEDDTDDEDDDYGEDDEYSDDDAA